MAANREAARDALKALLETALVGAGKPAQVVYGFQPATFNGQSPVVTVSGAGSDRPRQSFSTNRATFFLNVHVFVLYASEDGSWTEADAEDRLDLIEKTIAETLEANRKTADWQAIDYDGRSTADSVDIGGDEYRREIIPLKVEVF